MAECETQREEKSAGPGSTDNILCVFTFLMFSAEDRKNCPVEQTGHSRPTRI